jgi:HEAT repeat protein
MTRLDDGDMERVRDVLIEAVEDTAEDDLVRARAIEALGAISDEEVQNLIESIYGEDSLELRVGAIDAMGRSCDERWLPIVLKELINPAPEMRQAAAFATGEIGSEDAVAELAETAANDPEREVQIVAIHALGEIGGREAQVALTSLRYEGDDNVQDAIEEALAEVQFKEDPLGGLL